MTSKTRSAQDQPKATAGWWFRNTAELSGELSVGDAVTIGEAPLAVARAGWTRARGVFAEVRADRHGTHPLPAHSRLPGTGDGTAPHSPDQGATS